MARTTSALVQTLVTVAGGSEAHRDANIQPSIDMASAYLDGVIVKCSALGLLPATTLELIERNLAAHFYSISPAGQTKNRSIKTDSVGEGVSRTWVGPTSPTGVGYSLQGTPFGQNALLLDTTGCLRDDDAKAAKPSRKSSISWLGTQDANEDFDLL